MAITLIDSSIFTLDKGEVDDFVKTALRNLKIEELGGEVPASEEAQLKSLRLRGDGNSFIHYVKGVTKARPTFILIGVRMKTVDQMCFIALNIYKKRLHPKAFHLDSEEDLNGWDDLTIDQIVGRLG